MITGDIQQQRGYHLLPAEDDDFIGDVSNDANKSEGGGEEEESSPLFSASSEVKKGSTIGRMVHNILPFEKLPWSTFFCLSTWCAIPAAAYIVLFTQMGLGENFYYQLSHAFGEYAYTFAAGLGISAFFFWILDIDEFDSALGSIVRFICEAGMFTVFLILIILVSHEMPFGIITLYAIINPLFLLAVKSVFYRQRDTRTFVIWLSGPLFFIAAVMTVTFIIWCCVDFSNAWNKVTKVVAAEETHCEPNFEAYPNCTNADGSGSTCFYVDHSKGREELVFPPGCDHVCLDVYNHCANGFILWAGPVLMSLSMMFLSFFCSFLRADNGKSTEQMMMNFAKMWFFLLFLLWASASMSGAAAGVTPTLSALTLASVAGAAILWAAVYSKEERDKTQMASLTKIKEKLGNLTDIVRGLFVWTCSPIVVAYFLLSAINQLVRRLRLNPCAQPASDSTSSAGILTMKAERQLAAMRSWDRAKVLTYAVYWGIGYMAMQVFVTQMTVVFLSWLIESTADLGLGVVTGILAGVGIFMFLLPPVPGVPVYLTVGIVLAAKGHELLGWVGSIAYATGIALVLKLIASAMQQKLIGENLSGYVSVRQFVGVNSTFMKAMRILLSLPGLSVAKVAILSCGPDWPTSVLCGIMRLPLLSIMIGTIPVICLIFPTCLTGAFLYMASLKTSAGNPVYQWAGTLSTVTAAMTSLVLFGAMMVSVYYIEQTVTKHAEKINEVEDDKEVKAADEKDVLLQKCYGDATKWDDVPKLAKFALLSATILSIASFYMVQFFSDLCFIEHSLTDSYYTNLEGNLLNIFLPLGWAAVGLFVASWVLISMFTSWGKRRAKKLAETQEPLTSESEPALVI